METCCVVEDNNCKSPANLEKVRPAKGTCFACGLPVCSNCSVVIKYFDYGRKRICNNCIDDYKKSIQP